MSPPFGHLVSYSAVSHPPTPSYGGCVEPNESPHAGVMVHVSVSGCHVVVFPQSTLQVVPAAPATFQANRQMLFFFSAIFVWNQLNSEFQY